MKNLQKKFKKYLVEIIILTIAIFISVISLIIFLNSSSQKEEIKISETKNQITSVKKIFVDISGSVNKPGLYQLNNNSRIKEAIDKAGGLSDDADKGYFNRNFNLARFLSDQEKIYIPSVWEVQNGYFIENPQTLNYIQPINQQSIVFNSDSSQNLININQASLDELDTLPGIGKVLGQKIIDNRPYQSLEDLINKKVINKSVFEKIKDLISL
jgi:competence protein ComEA